MATPEAELARKTASRVEYRPGPVRVIFSLTNGFTSDGHELRCGFHCTARVVDSPADRKLFEEVLISRHPQVTADVVAQHFEPVVASAFAHLAATLPAEEWINGRHNQAMIDALIHAAKPAAFACGIELMPPFQADFYSASFHRSQLEAVARQRSAKHTSEQMENLQQAGDLLRKFEKLRSEFPHLPPGALLARINPVDQGSMLHTLLLASSQQTAATLLWAVAGPYLVRIDPRAAMPTTDLFPLPPTLGPLRSVQPAEIDGRQMLLVGARGGVFKLDPLDPKSAVAYSDPELRSELGFSRVIYRPFHKQIVACHSDGGIVIWDEATPDQPAVTLRQFSRNSLVSNNGGMGIPVAPAGAASGASIYTLGGNGSGSGSAADMGVRHLQTIDDRRSVFTAGPKVMMLEGTATRVLAEREGADFIAVVAEAGRIIAVCRDGTLLFIDRVMLNLSDEQRRPERFCAAAGLPLLGGVRLLLSSEDGAILCVGPDDPVTTTYLSAHRGVRMLTSAGDLIAGVSPDRQRVILWHTWDGVRPMGELFITAKTRHRMADLRFA